MAVRSLFIIMMLLGMTGTASADVAAGEAAMNRGDYTAALKEFQPLAEKGDMQAQVEMAYFYYHGKGVAQDRAEAAKWLGKAADQGSAYAQYNLGKMYATGNGVKKDPAEAVRYYPDQFVVDNRPRSQDDPQYQFAFSAKPSQLRQVCIGWFDGCTRDNRTGSSAMGPGPKHLYGAGRSEPAEPGDLGNLGQPTGRHLQPGFAVEPRG